MMNIPNAHHNIPVTSLMQAQPVEVKPERENQSKVFASVEGSAKSDSSQNQQFQAKESNHTTTDNTDSKDAAAHDVAKEKSEQQSEQQEKAQVKLEQQQLKQNQAEIQKLQLRDGEVRQHEAAHAAAGGSFAGAPQLEFETGPDGRRYAVGGEVKISTSAVPDNPQQTLQKAATIRAAALAPAEPSAQDRRVAAEASQMAMEAQAEILGMKQNEIKEMKEPVDSKQEENKLIDGREEDVEAEVVMMGQASTLSELADSSDAKTKPSSVKSENNEAFSIASGSEGRDLAAQLVELGVLDERQPVGGLLNLIV